MKLYGKSMFFHLTSRSVNYSLNLILIEISVKAIKIKVVAIQKVHHSERREKVVKNATHGEGMQLKK